MGPEQWEQGLSPKLLPIHKTRPLAGLLCLASVGVEEPILPEDLMCQSGRIPRGVPTHSEGKGMGEEL